MKHLSDGAPVTIIIICIFVILLALEYNKRLRLRNRNAIVARLNTIATENELSVNRYDIFGNHILGLDESKNIIFFFYDQQNDIFTFDIDKLTDCTLQKSLTGNTINEIDMYLKGTHTGPGYTLPLYNRFTNSGYSLRASIQRAEKWKTTIEDLIIESKLSAIKNNA